LQHFETVEPDEIDEMMDYEEIEEQSSIRDDPYPSIDKKREIIAFWRNNGRKRGFDAVQKRYKKLRYEKQLRRWEKQLQTGSKLLINSSFCMSFYSLTHF